MQSFPLMEFNIVKATTNPNILAGQPIQYWGKAGILTIYGNADDVGVLWNLNINDGQSNLSLVPQGSGLGKASTAGKVKANEDFIGQFPIPAGVQLMLPVTNTDASNDIPVSFLFAIT